MDHPEHQEGASDDALTKDRASTTIKKKHCEVFALIGTIGVAWIVLMLPVIFYYLPDDVYTTSTNVMVSPFVEDLHL